MRNMSFSETKAQMYARTKTVTRRLGWRFLKPGDIVQAVEKSQGLKKGEKITPICRIRVVAVRREKLQHITMADVIREGFSMLTKGEFVSMFCNLNRCLPDTVINRIEFEYCDAEGIGESGL